MNVRAIAFAGAYVLLLASPTVHAFSGTMTYFNTGLGSCGWTTADSDFIVAMNVQQYSLSVCGRTVCITNGGKTVQARVVDLCPSCVYGKLDASPAVFSSFADLGKGVIDISWDYCDGSGSSDPATSAAARSSATTTTTTTTSAPATSAIASSSTTTTSSSSSSSRASSVPSSTNVSGAGSLDTSVSVDDRTACYTDSQWKLLEKRDDDAGFGSVPLIRRHNGYPMSDEDLIRRGVEPGVDPALLEHRAGRGALVRGLLW